MTDATLLVFCLVFYMPLPYPINSTPSMKALKPYSFRPHLHLLDLSKLGHQNESIIINLIICPSQFRATTYESQLSRFNPFARTHPRQHLTRRETSVPHPQFPHVHLYFLSHSLVKQCFVVIMRMKHAHTLFSSVPLFLPFLLFDATLTKVLGLHIKDPVYRL